jgi:hypothetical protein
MGALADFVRHDGRDLRAISLALADTIAGRDAQGRQTSGRGRSSRDKSAYGKQ